MIKTSLLAAAAVASLAPSIACAQDVPHDAAREMEEGFDELLNDPTMPDRMAAMASAMVSVIEAMPVGQMEAALEGRAPTEEEMQRQLGDEMEIDREEVAIRTRESMLANREQMQRGIRAMVLMAPMLAQAANQMARAMEEAGIEDR